MTLIKFLSLNVRDYAIMSNERKSMQKKTDTSEFISKFIMQLEIEV